MKTRTGSHLALNKYAEVNWYAYQPLTRDVAIKMHQKYVCLGSSREAILLDMDSPDLDRLFQHFLKTKEEEEASTQTLDDELEDVMPESVVKSDKMTLEKLFTDFSQYPVPALQCIADYVSELFSVNTSAEKTEKEIAALIRSEQLTPDDEAMSDASLEPVKPVDLTLEQNKIDLAELVNRQLGLCRHSALFTGYLLTRCLAHFCPEDRSEVFRFRTLLRYPKGESTFSPAKGVRHAVIILVTEDKHCYLIDSKRLKDNDKQPKGLVMDMHKLTASKRNKLKVAYPQFEVATFVQEINEKYMVSNAENNLKTTFKP